MISSLIEDAALGFAKNKTLIADAALGFAKNKIKDKINSKLGGLLGEVAPGDAFKGINARGDAIQNWCWYALLPDMKDGGSSTFGVFNSTSPTVALPWYYVQTANLPWRKIATDSVQVNGHSRHYPQSYSVDQLTLGFFMDTKGTAQQYLHAWQAKILSNADPSDPNNQGKWGLPAEYKKDITIVLLDTSHKKMLTVKYVGCWPSDPDSLDLGGDSSTALVQNVSFNVEDVFVTITNDKGFIGNLKSAAIGYGVSALKGAVSGLLNKF